MLSLPDDPRFDIWRNAGWQGNFSPPATKTFPSGTTALHAEYWVLQPGEVIQGTLGDFGYPKTTLLFPTKSLYALFGKGPGGGMYGWSWAGALIRGTGVVFRDCIIQIGDQPSPSHFAGRGWNVFDVRSSLISNVHGINCDNFVFTRGPHGHIKDCTVQAVDTDHDGLERTGLSGHYAFKMTGDDSVIQNCKVINTKYQHEYSVEQTDRCVITDSSSFDGVMDEHANKEWCHFILWLRHSVGRKTRNPFASGGNPMYLLNGFQHVSSTYVDCRWNSGFLDVTKPPKMGPGTTMWITSITPPIVSNVRVCTTSFVNVRQAPSKLSALLGTQSQGKYGTAKVDTAYDSVHNIIYRFVNFDSGADGYTDDAKLLKLQ